MNAARGVCFIIGALIGGWLFFTYGPTTLGQIYTWARITEARDTANNPFLIAAVTVLGAALGAAGIGAGGFKLIDNLVSGWDRMHPGDKVNIFVGTFFGIIVTVPFMILFSAQGAALAAVLSVAMMLLVSTVVIYALNSIGDLLPWSKNHGRGRKSDIKVLDTNVIIDGRILDIVRCGFMDGPLYVPRFVLEELQYIADNAEPLKRQRGKRGLDVLQQMQGKFQLEIGTHDKLAADANEPVDSRLVKIARGIGGDLVTNDHNLNRVAALQEVRVINVNELALALRPTVLPGETMQLLIIKDGSQSGQGVGYLDDGTMIVVEGGRKHVGETIDVIVTQVHQTERGKMIFADAADLHEDEMEIGLKPKRKTFR